jgi:hypothetical protein
MTECVPGPRPRCLLGPVSGCERGDNDLQPAERSRRGREPLGPRGETGSGRSRRIRVGGLSSSGGSSPLVNRRPPLPFRQGAVGRDRARAKVDWRGRPDALGLRMEATRPQNARTSAYPRGETAGGSSLNRRRVSGWRGPPRLAQSQMSTLRERSSGSPVGRKDQGVPELQVRTLGTGSPDRCEKHVRNLWSFGEIGLEPHAAAQVSERQPFSKPDVGRKAPRKPQGSRE